MKTLRPLLPRFKLLGWSGDMIDGRGVDGWSLQFCWLGLTIEIAFGSVGRWYRRLDRLRAERAK